MRRAEMAQKLASEAHEAERLGDHRTAAYLLAQALRTLLTDPAERDLPATVPGMPEPGGPGWSKFLKRFDGP
jgi:hypothetical protein